ncbi:MAG: bifunctional precorrin-2 dehydrogenase/sirohydrochlorin ferrochelatase [Armatimonadota bacterium]|nr:bifunctional precorrin-2 dehydrogenase/sirohydrochlorin ferrochelatase [Armatimonadota bacterium]
MARATTQPTNSSMAHYPINLDLKNKKCIVIGGGMVAERKAISLLEFGARVLLIAPELTPALRQLAEKKVVEHIPAEYQPGMLEGAFLVIAATDSNFVNKSVSEEAKRLGVLVNVVDAPELCTFFVPAFVKRGDLIISVSTSGKSPALAKHIREKLEAEFGLEFGMLAELLGSLREDVRAKYPNHHDRVAAYERILNSNVLALLAEGRSKEALEVARKCI